LEAAAEQNRRERLVIEMAQPSRDRSARSVERQNAQARENWIRWFSGFVRQASRRLVDRYEPAKHYMRGPGPKTLEQRRKDTASTTRD
jgi:hypothetical protein